MTYLISARDLSKQGGGTKTYIEGLLTVLNNSDKRNEFYVLHNSEEHKSTFPDLELIYTSIKNPFIFEWFMVAYYSFKLKTDGVVGLKNFVTPLARGNKFLLIYDLGYFYSHNAYTLADKLVNILQTKTSALVSEHVFTISKFTKLDINRFLKVPLNKITVMYPALPTWAKEGDFKNCSIHKKYQLPKKYVLFTGGITPRKNLSRLIEAFLKVTKVISDINLVITGSRSWSQKEVVGLIEANDNIYRIGHVEEKDMPCLYRHASAFAYPSLFEGFGIPVLEAQYMKCPVVCSDKTALKEVTKLGCEIVDPYSVDSIYNGLMIVLTNKSRSKRLINDGVQNLKRFKPNEEFSKLINVLSKV